MVFSTAGFGDLSQLHLNFMVFSQRFLKLFGGSHQAIKPSTLKEVIEWKKGGMNANDGAFGNFLLI